MGGSCARIGERMERKGKAGAQKAAGAPRVGGGDGRRSGNEELIHP